MAVNLKINFICNRQIDYCIINAVAKFAAEYRDIVKCITKLSITGKQSLHRNGSSQECYHFLHTNDFAYHTFMTMLENASVRHCHVICR